MKHFSTATSLSLFFSLMNALALDDLQPLGDEFGNSATLSQWQRVNDVEGWNADQLETWDVDTTTAGHMRLSPYTSAWYMELKGVLAFKEIQGDFVASARFRLQNRHDTASPENPPVQQFSLAGILVRNPTSVTSASPTPVTTSSVWPPAANGSDWTENQQNYIFLSYGRAGGNNGGRHQYEVKTTRNSNSSLYYNQLGVPTPADGGDVVELQVVRINDTMVVMRRHPGGNWIVENRYSSAEGNFPAFGDTLQVGITVYTDWGRIGGPYYDGGNAQSQFHHNYLVIDETVDSNVMPDLHADVDYVRYERPHASLNESMLMALVTTRAAGSVVGLPGTGAGQYLGDSAITELGSIQPATQLAFASEAAGMATVSVNRNGVAHEACSVDYTWMAGTAGSGDFTPQSGTLTWAAGDSAPKQVSTVVASDGIAEGIEMATLRLFNPEGPVTLGASQSQLDVTVQISDHPADQWRLDTFGAAAGTPRGALDGDFDGDGVPNGIELALATSATQSGSIPVMEITNTADAATFQFPRAANLSGLRLLVESTTNLSQWVELAEIGGSTTPQITLDDTGTAVTLTDQRPVGSRAFYRIRVRQ